MTNFSVGATNSSDRKNNPVETIYKQTDLNTATHTITDGNDLSSFANLSAGYKVNDAQTIGSL